MTEKQKEKYANFLNEVSEILGLNKPIDVLRLCAVTDKYFKPIEKRIAELEEEIEELEKENAELKSKTQWHDLRKNPDDLPKKQETI